MDLTKEANSIPKSKIVIVGESGVGKSSIIHRFIDNKFSLGGVQTMGVDMRTKAMELPSGKKIRLELWDTAGQERYRAMVGSFFTNAKAIVFAFDITDQISLEKLTKWCDEVEQSSTPDALKIVLGNKSDMDDAKKIKPEVVEMAIKEFKTRMTNVKSYYPVSALSGDGINEAFTDLATELLEGQKFTPVYEQRRRITVQNSQQKQEQAQGCNC